VGASAQASKFYTFRRFSAARATADFYKTKPILWAFSFGISNLGVVKQSQPEALGGGRPSDLRNGKHGGSGVSPNKANFVGL
jgi:hypothetical protein